MLIVLFNMSRSSLCPCAGEAEVRNHIYMYVNKTPGEEFLIIEKKNSRMIIIDPSPRLMNIDL